MIVARLCIQYWNSKWYFSLWILDRRAKAEESIRSAEGKMDFSSNKKPDNEVSELIW